MLFNVTPEGRGILRHSKIDYNTRMISLFVFLLHQMEFPSCIVSIKFRSARSNEAAKKFVPEMGKLAFSNPISSGKFRNFPSKHLLALCKIFETFQQEILQAKTKVSRLTTIRQCETDGNIIFSSSFISLMENSLFRFDALKVFSAVHVNRRKSISMRYKILKDIKRKFSISIEFIFHHSKIQYFASLVEHR